MGPVWDISPRSTAKSLPKCNVALPPGLFSTTANAWGGWWWFLPGVIWMLTGVPQPTADQRMLADGLAAAHVKGTEDPLLGAGSRLTPESRSAYIDFLRPEDEEAGAAIRRATLTGRRWDQATSSKPWNDISTCRCGRKSPGAGGLPEVPTAANPANQLAYSPLTSSGTGCFYRRVGGVVRGAENINIPGSCLDLG